MLSYKEYKVLDFVHTIQQQDIGTEKDFTEQVITGKIKTSLKLEKYELNELNYTYNIFTEETDIFPTRLTDEGLCAWKNFKRDYFVRLFEKYGFPLLGIILTALLAALFST